MSFFKLLSPRSFQTTLLNAKQIASNISQRYSTQRPVITEEEFRNIVSQPKLPFWIERTKSNRYPVYTDFRNARGRKLTVVRKYRGDVAYLKNELKQLLGSETEIIEKVGRLEIKGLHVPKIVTWLKEKGY
mmetsp:Transcript_29855/g.41986  ORF Transcript_29855/g.41986 Transcript_29855/m.41986 type:complete len:131 (+) Transcript_29855:128-520(+)